MSLTFRIHHVLGPREGPAESLSPRNEQKARALGLTSATGLVVGSITGTGVGIALIGLWGSRGDEPRACPVDLRSGVV